MKRLIGSCVLAYLVVLLAVATLVTGCGGGGGSRHSLLSGTVADINRNVLVGADVWVDDTHATKSLQSGVYRIQDVRSGWRTIWAQATVNGETWVGSTAAEVLEDQPTFNINITLAPERETSSISGTVRDDTGYPVEGARVLLTTRLLAPQGDTSAYDGPYGSIVAVTDIDGHYVMNDVPNGYVATISASKVGFRNDEVSIDTGHLRTPMDFALVESNLGPNPPASPVLDLIESSTMPDTLTRSSSTAYKAVKAYTSQRYWKALASQIHTVSRSVSDGSLIEIDLYWNALDLNHSQDVAGYGIYRSDSAVGPMPVIDFIRDPYANFYGDTGIEIRPDQTYYYRVSTVNVEFLDRHNNSNPDAESDTSNELSIAPLGQLHAIAPAQGGTVSPTPTFTWSRLNGAENYFVYVYDEFPTLPLTPGVDDESNPGYYNGTFPIWPTRLDPRQSTVGSDATSITYTGPNLQHGRTYYWIVIAEDRNQSAFSYGELRSFVVQ